MRKRTTVPPTDLRNREIVLSKLVVRLANLTLMLLTGLPIVALLQFLGGIDPDLVLAGLIATELTMASLASLSILNSVYARKSRDAILYTYLEMAAYGLLSGFSQLLRMTPLAAWKFDWGRLSVTAGDAIDWFSAAGREYLLDHARRIYRNLGDRDKYLALRSRRMEYGADYHDLATFHWELGERDKAMAIAREGLEKAKGRMDELRAFVGKRTR